MAVCTMASIKPIVVLFLALCCFSYADEKLDMLQAKVQELKKDLDAMASIILEQRARIDLLEREADEAAQEDDWPEDEPKEIKNDTHRQILVPDAAWTNWYRQWTGVTNDTVLDAIFTAASVELNTDGHYGIFNFPEKRPIN